MEARRSGTVSTLAHPAGQIACGIVAAVALVYDTFLFGYGLERQHGNDFGRFYYAVASWRGGGSLYSQTVATALRLPGDRVWQLLDLNPPHFHLLVWPLAGLSLSGAATAWLLLNVWAGAVAVLVTLRELRLRPAREHLVPIAAVVLSSAGTGATLATNQVSGLVMLPMALAWIAARQGRECVAGVWMGILISLKVFLGLFLVVWLVRRQWATLSAALVACAGCFGVGLLAFGLQEHREWMVALGRETWAWSPMNGSWQGILTRAFAVSPYYQPAHAAPAWIVPLWLIGAALIVVTTLIRVRGNADVDTVLTSTTLAAILVSPLGWVYYLWLAVPGVIGLRQRFRPALALTSGALLLVPLVAVTALQPHGYVTVTLGSAYWWGTCCLWLASIRQRPTPSWTSL
jgi:hypothetical protein